MSCIAMSADLSRGNGMRIGGFDTDARVLVVAEIGNNHEGSVAAAQELVRAAHESGVDAVKFQTFKAERVITRDAPKANYQLQTTNPQESQFEMLRKLELNLEVYQELTGVI